MMTPTSMRRNWPGSPPVSAPGGIRRSLGMLGAERVYKAAGGNLPTGRSVARAAWEEFSRREAGARRSNARLAEALFDPILGLLRRSAREQLKQGDEEFALADLARELVQLAKLRSIATAGSVNDTTAKMREADQEPYTLARAAQIGLTEASWATHAAREAALVLADKKRWTWQCSGSCCVDCRSLAGKTVVIGEDFVAKSGAKARHPPLHPNCKCGIKAVSSRR